MPRLPNRAASPPREGGGFGGAPSGGVASRRAVRWLALAAAPTFAIMAVLTAVSGSADMICMTAHDPSPLSGMVVMYGLMSAFHLAPWLKWLASRRALSTGPMPGRARRASPESG